jgi:hypothetical protein
LTIDDAVVFEQIRWSYGSASPREIAWRCYHQSVCLCQLARFQRGIWKSTEPESRVDILRYEVDHTIVHHEFQSQFWMGIEKRAELRDQMQAPKGHRRTDAQSSFEPRPGTLRCCVRFVRFSNSAQSVLVKDHSCFRRRQPASRPDQQTHTQPLFQSHDHFRNPGLSEFEIAGGRSKRSSLDNPDEELHFTKAIHSYSTWE